MSNKYMKTTYPYIKGGPNWEDPQLTEEEYKRRQGVIGVPVTLNGVPAEVVGAKLRYAVVVIKEPDPIHHVRIEVEYSWRTVFHIIQNKEGKFTS